MSDVSAPRKNKAGKVTEERCGMEVGINVNQAVQGRAEKMTGEQRQEWVVQIEEEGAF